MRQLYFFLLLTVSSLSAQDFSSVDNTVHSYPKLITAEKLATKIASDFTTDENKIRAVFIWLAKNVTYNLEELYNPKQKRIAFRYRNEAEKQAKIKAIKDNIVRSTLATRKAVCEGYAQTFSKVCTLLNIENEVIKGYVRNSSYDIGKIMNNTNHAWNAVKINNKWQYIDATWAAGAVMNGKWQRNFNNYYFNIPKEKYFFTHYPEDSLWQLRIKRMGIDEYFNQPIYTSSFLKKDYILSKPTSGILKKDANSAIKITLKNIKSNQEIHFGFRGHQYMKQPTVSFKNNAAEITIVPPSNSKEAFLIIDGQVVLEFLII
ncbi:transglutaminase domain-containing protein [uncultured Tenacibaculum sp.]|uniref:transglutaminase domain-containing protein n=1 Tax=uncultured Tenacibaculum sp. TaxID=174713 RepID=UPI0026256082|nr:transglutaminase domain-containing protein [uncultured Tenacibaculum sp.]